MAGTVYSASPSDLKFLVFSSLPEAIPTVSLSEFCKACAFYHYARDYGWF